MTRASETSENFNPKLSGICKDCGNGTLNNDIVEAFVIEPDIFGDYEQVVCKAGGSTHVDVISL